MKKTFVIEVLITEVNQRNANSTCDAKVREGWNDALEWILHKADRYYGYRYLTCAEVPEGQAAGIIYSGFPGGINSYPDETRREYL